MHRFLHRPRTVLIASLVPVVLLGGCATFSADGGFDSVSRITKDRIGKDAVNVKSDADEKAVLDLTKALLAKPLTVDDAVQVALYNNRGLRSSYAELGIAEADLVQAGRLPNPAIGFKHTRQAGDVLIERKFTVNLFTAPLAQRFQQRQFDLTQLLVANEVLRVAAETRKAWFDAVSATQSVTYARQVRLSAEAGADLADQMTHAGNWGKLDQAREQAFLGEASMRTVRAERASIAAREKLTRLLGLSNNDLQFQLPDRLPDLPAQPMALDNAESIAMDNRLDIQAGKLETAGLASSLGLTRTTRFVNAIDFGYVRSTATGQAPERGYELSIEIPLFDWGEARVAKAEAIYMQAVNDLARTAINARSEVRESYQAYRISYDLAKQYRDVIVPLRKKISDENLLRYQGMLIGVFELLADAREQVTSVDGYIEALKDFWIAETDLQSALGGKLPNNTSVAKGQ